VTRSVDVAHAVTVLCSVGIGTGRKCGRVVDVLEVTDDGIVLGGRTGEPTTRRSGLLCPDHGFADVEAAQVLAAHRTRRSLKRPVFIYAKPMVRLRRDQMRRADT
jgi:hypothetical protein